MTLSKTVADDLLQCEKYKKWCLLKLTCRKAFVNGNHCSKFQSVKQASLKQLFTNRLGLRIISFTNLQPWKKWREKRNGRCSNVGIGKFKKLISLEKTMWLNTTLNTSKLQNILPKIKTYSLSIKIELPGKRTFMSSLCVTDFIVSSPSLIRSEPFYTQNEDISLPDHSASHLDHRYL